MPPVKLKLNHDNAQYTYYTYTVYIQLICIYACTVNTVYILHIYMYVNMNISVPERFMEQLIVTMLQLGIEVHVALLEAANRALMIHDLDFAVSPELLRDFLIRKLKNRCWF